MQLVRWEDKMGTHAAIHVHAKHTKRFATVCLP